MSLLLNGTDGVTFNDGSEQWAAASPIGTKNLIINGNMQIAQRGTSSAGITAGHTYYTVDRFNFNVISIGTWTQTHDTDVPTGQGFSNSMKLQCTSSASLSAGTLLEMHQVFEGQMLQHLKKGTANAEALTLSFWVKTNKTGTYTTSLIDNDNTRHIGATYTISSADTWEKKTITFSGDTSGALDNDNNASFRVVFHFAAGSDWTSGTADTTWNATISANRAVGQTVNLADSTSNYINITGVQLEVGDTATPFEHRPYDMEFQRCIRYFRTVGDGMIGRASSASVVYYSHHFENPMRATPTMSIASGASIRFGNLYSADWIGASSSIILARANNISVVGQVTGFSGMTTADMLQSWQSSPPGWLFCNAEL